MKNRHSICKSKMVLAFAKLARHHDPSNAKEVLLWLETAYAMFGKEYVKHNEGLKDAMNVVFLDRE